MASDEETVDGSHLLVATGRKATVDGLDLEAAGVRYDRRGIAVNRKLKTSNSRIYAIGDVAAGQPQFTHAANYHAGLVIRNALFRLPVKVNVHAIPWVTYTEPELAQTGLTEAQAREQGHKKLRIMRWPYHDNDRAVAERTTHGHIKVITDTEGQNPRRHHCRRAGWRADHAVDPGDRTEAQHPRHDRDRAALSDTVGNRQTRGHRLLYAQFDAPHAAAHHRLAANLRLRRFLLMNTVPASEPPVETAPPNGRRARLGLSSKLLFLTILFVMVAEVLIYVPSIANFRLNWLNDRLAAAHTAALVLDAAPSGMVPESLAKEILSSIGARAVAVKMGKERRMLAAYNVPSKIHQNMDMRSVTWWHAIMNAFDTLAFSQPGDVMRLVGPAPMAHGDFLEIILDEAPLRKAMVTFSVNILLLSLVISGITAMLVYFALHYLLVRPMWRITGNMVAFRADPENPNRIITGSGRRDEIGTAEEELAAMQRELASMLHQKNRLAALGLAVSKINHDLRNLLASAQLFSDQLSTLEDPKVQRFAPKLMRTLERAIAFCQSTLSYGAAQESAPERKTIQIEPLIEEVHEALGLGLDVPIRWIVSVERGLTVEADHDQLFRILSNIARNAVQALEARGTGDPARDQIRLTGRREGGVVVLEVSDTGPGVPEKARAHMFQAFQSSTRAGGTGLGLAIAAELVRAHGGDIALVPGTIGATFRFTIPDRAIDLNAHRDERARA